MAQRITRSQTFTSIKKKQEYYSDFLDDFSLSPLGTDLVKITNEKDVTQSIRNLLSTNFGDRLFQPGIGSNLNASLFENSGIVLQNMLLDSIKSTINTFEPRAVLEDVSISDQTTGFDPSQPGAVDQNTVSVTITYYLVNNPSPVTINVLLNRTR